MTFDEAYEKYKVIRGELRAAQGALSRAEATREGLNITIGQLSRDYARLHRNLVAAQGALKPELDKEVASAMTPELETVPPDINNQPAEPADRKADQNGTNQGK